MPWRRHSSGFCNLAGAVFAATTFSNSDGKLSSGTQRKGLWRNAGDDGIPHPPGVPRSRAATNHQPYSIRASRWSSNSRWEKGPSWFLPESTTGT